MELQRLPAFDAFARHLSFTRAAQELHVSQPALHMQVSRLADELGVALYRRVGQRLELTAEGARVAELAARCVSEANRLAESLRLGEPDAPVRLAAGEATHRHLLLPALRALHEAGPPGVALLVRDRAGALEALRRGEADVAVAPIESPPPKDLWHRPARVISTRLALPAGHRLARRRTVQLRDLEGESLVLPPPGRPLRLTADALLAAHGVKTTVAVEASGWELLLDLVSIGLGLCPVNETVPLPAGVVSRALPEWPPLTLHVLTRPDPVPPAVRTARETLIAHLAQKK